MKGTMEQLIETIRQLEGNKIVTLFSFEKQQGWQYDFSKDGTIGYDRAHEMLFKAMLLNAMHGGGSIVIRQFTNIKNNDIPIKRIYGISLHNGNWHPISADEMEIAHCTDSKTGKKIPKEKNVVFDSISL